MCHFFPANFTFHSWVRLTWETLHSRLPPGRQCRDSLFHLKFPSVPMQPLAMSGVGFHRRALGGCMIPETFSSSNPLVINFFIFFCRRLGRCEHNSYCHDFLGSLPFPGCWFLCTVWRGHLVPWSRQTELAGKGQPPQKWCLAPPSCFSSGYQTTSGPL